MARSHHRDCRGVSTSDTTFDDFKTLTSRGLQVPDSLVNLKAGDQVIGGSNLGKNARYDQILHLPTLKKRVTNHDGTLDFFSGDAFIKELFPNKNYTREKAGRMTGLKNRSTELFFPGP